MFGRKKKEGMINSEIDAALEDAAIDDVIDRAIDETLAAPDGIEISRYGGINSETEAMMTLAKLFDVYQPGVIFSEPTIVGDQAVITASEVYVAMGLGFGHGAGDAEGARGEGGGGGGGGASGGRPTAAIIIGPTGVRVEPIVDVTKITLAFITMVGALFMAWRAMRRQSKPR